jgi:hypothetical protein
MNIEMQINGIGMEHWEYHNPWYRPDRTHRWVAGKEGGMHPTFVSYNAPEEYRGHQIFERVRSTDPSACVCDVLANGVVLTQRVTVRSCKAWIDAMLS